MDGSVAAPPLLRQDSDGQLTERARFIAFVNDPASEAALREGFGEMLTGELDVRRMGCRQAVALLRKIPTPQVIVVDISRDESPISALMDLSEVVEPDARVLVVGDREDVNFYRQITRGLGASEYLYKPLARSMVARHFGPWVSSGKVASESVQGGRVITVTGAAGGVGTTTIAANLAWHCATNIRRHTVLLDPDLHTGTAALILGAKSSSGLKTALEMPERLDELLVERSAFAVNDRLSVLSSEENLDEDPVVAPEAARQLLSMLRRRYNFIVADVPFRPASLQRDLIDLSHQRIVVTDPTLASIRDTLRLLALPNSASQSRRSILVLNKLGAPGTLGRHQVEQALGMAPDVTFPYQPRVVNEANTLGKPVAEAKGPFKASIEQLAQEAAFVRRFEGEDAKGSAASGLRRLLAWRR